MPNEMRNDLRENLETKLAIYDRFKANLAPEGTLIFTNRPEIWSTDKGPFIIASEPIPEPKPHYHADEPDFVQEVIDFFRPMIRHPEYCYLCLRLFLFPTNELHVHLSHNRTAQSEPIQAYMKVPIPYSNKLSGNTITIQVFTYSPEIIDSVGPQEVEVGIDLRDRQRQIVRQVGLRFMSDELKRNLKEKVEKFVRLTPYDAGTAVLFQLLSGYWPKELKFVLIQHPTPPLPSYGDDDYKENIISRYILEYVKDVAEELKCSPFYAVCSIKKTKKKLPRWNVHLMFSQYEESLKCVSEPHLSTEDPPAKSIVRMPMYSNELYTEWYSKIRPLFYPELGDDSDQESPMDTDDENFDTAADESSDTAADESSDTGDDDSYETGEDESSDTGSEEETEEGGAQVQTPEYWDELLGRQLTSNLMTKVRAFVNDGDAKARTPVIFVDAPNFWPPGQYKVIPEGPLPPRSLFTKAADLTFRRNATERDVLNFVKWVPTQLKSCPRIYAACSKFGMDLCLETHLMFSLDKKPIMLASTWGCSTTEDPTKIAQKKYPLLSSLVREPPSSPQSSETGPSSQASGSRPSYLVNISEFKTKPKLSLDIKKNLDYKLKLFQSAAPYEKGTAVLFADKPAFWPKDLKFVVLDDPPVPCFYQEFQSFSLAPWVRLMLDYLKERATLEGCVPFYASFSLKGYKEQRKQKKEGLEFMFSQSKAAIPAPNSADYMTTEDAPESDVAMDTGPEEYVSLGPVLSPRRTRVETEPPRRRAKKRKGCLRSPRLSLTRSKKSKHRSQDRRERSRSSGRERR